MMASQRLMKGVEVNYRGIFQKTLGRRIGSDIVFIAHSEGKTAFSNGRYSDAPERNGIPSKYFAFVSPTLSEEELEAEAGASMDIEVADVSVVVDDTLVKGVEPWAWHGVRPINEKVAEGSTLLVVTRKSAEELLKFVEKKPFEYNIATLEGDASFAGLWYYNDDFTDVRVLGAIAKVAPEIIGIDSVEKHVRNKYKSEEKVKAARDAYNTVKVRKVTSNDGIDWPYEVPKLPNYKEMEEGAVVPAIKRGYKKGPRGQSRSENFKRFTTKSMRPVVRFDTCTKCTLCWAECPDEAFDPTDTGHYDVNYEYCTGCGKCAQVCPVEDCIVMVDELKFDDNSSFYEKYMKDPKGYVDFVEEKKGKDRVVHPFVTGKGFTVEKVEKPAPFKEAKK